MKISLVTLVLAGFGIMPSSGVIVASDNLNAANATDLAGVSTGTGFATPWTRTSAASTSTWTLNANRAIYKGGISDSTNYARTLASPVTVSTTSTVTVSYDLIIGGGSGDGNLGRGIGIRLKNGSTGVLTIGKAANRAVALYPGSMEIGTTSIAPLSGAVSGTTIALNTTLPLVTTLTYDGSNTQVSLTNGATTATASLAGQVTFDTIEIAGYHASTTSNGVDNLLVDVSVVADPKLLVASEADFVNTGGEQNFSIPVSNTGSTNPLNISSVTVSGAHAEAFEVDETSFVSPVAPGGIGTVQVGFTPSGGFTHTATLTINSDDAAEPAQQVDITVVVRDPEIGLDVGFTAIDFGQQAYPGTSLTESFNLYNDGDFNDLTVSSVHFTGPGTAAYSVPNLPQAIAPGGSTSFDVVFTPGMSDGSFQAIMEITTNDPVVPVIKVPVRALVGLQTPDEAIVSHFTFDDETLPYNDSGFFANHGTAAGDAQRTTAARAGAGALLLDGTGDYLNVGGGIEYAGLTNDGDGFTVATWAKVGSSGSVRGIFNINGSSNGWGTGLNAGGAMRASAYLIATLDAPSAVPPVNEWSHLAWVFRLVSSTSGVNLGRIDFYIDGLPVRSVNMPQRGLLSSTAGFLIGALTPTTGAFTGALDDLRVYDRELGDVNIAALFASYPAAAEGYASWAESGVSDPDQRSAGDDPDKDGIANLMEYALGFDPEVPSVLPSLSSGTITWPKGAQSAADSKLVYVVKTSTDLSTWDTATPTTNTSSQISYQLPNGEAKRFVRLEVNLAP